MQQEIRFATFNVCNLAPPGMRFYANLEPYTAVQYEAKIAWIARQLDIIDADVIGFQEIFSQAALKDALDKTQKYRHAQHVGFDPDVRAEQLTPSVALVSRLPVAARVAAYTDFPHKLSIQLPGVADVVTRFTRPVLHARIQVSDALAISVFIVHLKSKCPDYRNGQDGADPAQFGVAVLRSLIRRGTEALGLRYLVNDQMQDRRMPLIVMGDFNDVIGSVTAQLVMGTGIEQNSGFDDRLFDSCRIQSCRAPLRDVGYTLMSEGGYETIDHILVSQAFNPASPFALGEVLDVAYFNDHIALKQAEASDHGIVLARIKLYQTDNAVSTTSTSTT
jgi:endonuclease/exonuclease/phosphatase family metal-dependent hydrolase